MVARSWLLVACLICPAFLAEPNDEDQSPTQQPPTRGQDFGRCAHAALPEVINLAPVTGGWFYRSGKWVDKMGAERVNWDQYRVRIDYTNLDYYVDLKPWFQAKVLRNPDLDLEHLRVWLPAPRNKNYRAMTTIVYVDCEGVPMYISREFQNQEYEIYNHLGQLVVTGHPSQLIKGQLYFEDDKGLAFALAGSPTIAEVATGFKEVLPQYHQYDFEHWQLWYTAGYNSATYLKEPDHRWVIAAVVQEHAILKTISFSGARAILLAVPEQYVLCLVLIALFCMSIVGVCCLSMRNIFFMVYPRMKVNKGNPFLIEDIGGLPYGSCAETSSDARSDHGSNPGWHPIAASKGMPSMGKGGYPFPPFSMGKGMPSMGKGGYASGFAEDM